MEADTEDVADAQEAQSYRIRGQIPRPPNNAAAHVREEYPNQLAI